MRQGCKKAASKYKHKFDAKVQEAQKNINFRRNQSEKRAKNVHLGRCAYFLVSFASQR